MAGAAAVAGPMMLANLKSIGAIVQGEAGGRAADAEEQIAMQNAGLARSQAAFDEQRQRSLALKTIGAARAGYAAGGVSIEGSAADVLENSAMQAELDAQMIRTQGENKARAFESDARMSRFKGKASRIGGYFNAASSMMDTAMSAASMGAGGGGGGGGIGSGGGGGGGGVSSGSGGRAYRMTRTF